MAFSKVTGEELEALARCTANDGTNATLTVDVRGDLSADRMGLTSVVLNGAGAHVDAANGRRRYRVRIEEVL
jgi:hypothetical protein